MLQHRKNSIQSHQGDGSEGPSLNKKNLLFDNHYLFWLLWPLFTEQLFMFAVGVADSVMVATVGEDAVSAVSLVDSVMMLIIALMAALSTGGAVVVGQLLGQKKTARAVNAADQLVLAALLISLIITGLLYLLQRPILTWSSATSPRKSCTTARYTTGSRWLPSPSSPSTTQVPPSSAAWVIPGSAC